MYQRVHNVEATPDIPRRLPRGTHGLDRRWWRRRSARASSRRSAGRSPRRATPPRRSTTSCAAPGVSKKTFYEHFTDKLDCFLAAYEAASDELLEHVRAAQDARDGEWVERTRAGIHAYLRWLAAEPALARVFLIEIAAAGPEALELRERMRDRYAERMRELQTANSVPDEIFHAVVAGVDDLVVRRLREGGDLLELEPALLYLQVSLLS